MEIRHENDVDGLTWIHAFGWLRSAELGRLMWPNDKYARTRADRVIRSWLDRHLVIERTLPNGARRAVVLSSAGATLLKDEGVEDAKSGKDWGETSDAGWHAPNTWQHDLIAAGVLATMYVDGYNIIPENKLRQENPGLEKIPDGLAWNDQDVLWLEVENARKTGKAMHKLAAALCAVANGTCAKISGKQPTKPVVAYVKNCTDERNLRINHRIRVRTAIQLAATKELTVTWAECELTGCGVSRVFFVHEDFASPRVFQILQKLNARGWTLNEAEVWETRYGPDGHPNFPTFGHFKLPHPDERVTVQ